MNKFYRIEFKRLFLCFVGFFVFLSALMSVQAQVSRQLVQTDNSKSRIALVIGNGGYRSVSALPNPTNDAADMASALQSLGFEVMSGTDQTKRGMEKLIREFGDKLVKQGGIGLFYYAGHGIQVGGKNYLIPVDAEIPEEDEVQYAAVPIDFVLSKMASADNSLNMIILDACRNNPFSRSWRTARNTADNQGLAKMSPPKGTLVLYATEPGSVASDGNGRNGLFTAAMLKKIKQPGIEYDRLVKQISAEVWETSGGKQIPWKEGISLIDFYFVPNGNSSTAVSSAPDASVNEPKTNFSAPPVKNAPPQNAVKLEEVQLNFKSGLFNDVIVKGRQFLENDSNNSEVNAMVGYSFLTKNDSEQSFIHLSKAVRNSQPIILPAKRGRDDALKLGHLLTDATITVAKEKIQIQDGDKLFQTDTSAVTAIMDNYGGQCPVAIIRGIFTETRSSSDKTKTEQKEFVLFPLSAALTMTKKNNLNVQMIACSDAGIISTTIVKLINDANLSR